MGINKGLISGFLFWVCFFWLVCGLPIPAALLMTPNILMMGYIYDDKKPESYSFIPRPRLGW